jgi:hypothetical protein
VEVNVKSEFTPLHPDTATLDFTVNFVPDGIFVPDFKLVILEILFVTVFVEQWLTSKNHLPAIIGLLCSVGALLIFGPDRFLIPSMISITIILCILKNRMDFEGGKGNEC